MTVKPLVLTADAFVKMIHWMADYANFKSIMTPNWVEAMGIMFCRETPDKYIIAEAAGITYGNVMDGLVRENPKITPFNLSNWISIQSSTQKTFSFK